ncbi:MAG: TonB-dependent receptor [Nitrospirae bacterium]|nr:TonB-dependent receptor [Nitrospirota bacterium]
MRIRWQSLSWRFAWSVILFFSFPLIPVGAQQSPMPIQDVVISATKTTIPVGQTISSVTVLTADDLQRMGVRTVSEALRYVSGVDQMQQGGAGKLTSVFLRGGESSHTLVLIDSIPLNSPTLGGSDFADITVDNIERIEIIRGPQGPLYGSDAMGGVINIITQKGSMTGAALSVESGSFGTIRTSISTQVRQDEKDMALSASRWETEGISALKSGTEEDGYQNTTLSLRLGRTLAAGRLELTSRLMEGRTDLDGCKFVPVTFLPYDCDNPDYDQDRRLVVAGVRYQHQANVLEEQVLSASVTSERLINRDPDPNGINSRVDTQIRTVEWQHNRASAAGALLTFGYEWKEKAGENAGVFRRSIANHGIFLQDHRGIGTPLEFLAGLRWDGNSQYEDAWTYRVMLATTSPGGARWHVQYGTGFRGPELNALFWPGGNPDLKPEKSRSWETGLLRSSGTVTTRVTYFHNAYEDLIQWYPVDPNNPFGDWTPQNVGEAVSEGWEAELTWSPLGNLRFIGSYTYDDTENRKDSGYLIRRPLNKYNTRMELGSPGRLLGLSYFHSGKRFEQVGNQSFLPAYDRVDLYASYLLARGMDTFIRIENLMDKEYEEAGGYGTAGFSTYGGIRLSF